MRIALVTTCKGRLHHLKATLPKNINDRGRNDAVFVVLDYNDTAELGDYIGREHAASIDAGRLVYYRSEDRPRFHMAHAKNMGHRCAMLEKADVLVTLDADNLTGPGFVDYLQNKFGDPALSFLCPDFKALPPPGQRFNVNDPTKLGRGFAGRMAIRTQDFVKIGGYNEIFATWRGEDIDLIARLNRLKLKRGAMDPLFLHAIAHSTELRFREYPEAEEFENSAIYEITEKAHDTVVNYGNFGCGTVFRNFAKSIPITLGPLPTRVFGIGMQRTGTTSLHEAFKLLGLDAGHWKSGEWSRTIWQEMNRWGTSRTMELDYALSDNPFPMLYQKLDEAYPGSKFVLTVRDEDSWIQSMEKFWTFEGNPRRWTWDIDGFSHKMHGITYGITHFDEVVFRERYRRHNAEVRQHFADRPGDLLQLDINERTTMGPLCKFLGVPEISTRFPHHNKGGNGKIESPALSVIAVLSPFHGEEVAFEMEVPMLIPVENSLDLLGRKRVVDEITPGALEMSKKRRRRKHHHKRFTVEVIIGSLVFALFGLAAITGVLLY